MTFSDSFLGRVADYLGAKTSAALGLTGGSLTFNKIAAGSNSDYAHGVARTVNLRFNAAGERYTEVVIHELGHIIDYQAGRAMGLAGEAWATDKNYLWNLAHNNKTGNVADANNNAREDFANTFVSEVQHHNGYQGFRPLGRLMPF